MSVLPEPRGTLISGFYVGSRPALYEQLANNIYTAQVKYRVRDDYTLGTF